jgi:dTDP-4-amino-4,6-dideoxygalactose transaminase
MCVTNDAALAERMEVLRVHGGKPKYYHALIGGNFRIDELQAAVLNVKFRHLDEWSAGRQRNAAYYNAAFARAKPGETVEWPHASLGFRHVYNQYVVRVKDRDALREYLTGAGIGTEIYYPVPLHLQQCFAYLGYKAGDFPQSERAAAETLALPIYPELSETQLQYVVDTIIGFYRG